MGLFSWLTGGGDTASKVIETASSGLDMMFYTDEEKSIAAQKVLDFKLAWLKATSGQNLARRIIAIGVVSLWILLVLAACIVRIWSEEGSNFLFNVLKDIVNTPFMIIIGFYFAAQIIDRFKNKD